MPALFSADIRKMIEYFEEIDSTNKRAEIIGKNGAEEFSFAAASIQNSGRGRSGRSWSSGTPDGLYFSVVLRPGMNVDKVSMLTLVMANSICRFFETLGIDCQIKWPNDLVINGKKICGILTECFFDEKIKDPEKPAFFLVTGVGINFNNPSFEKELADKATSVFLETGKRINVDDKEHRIDIIGKILKFFREDYESVLGFGNLSPIINKYNEKSVNVDSRVRILDPKGEYEALSLGITPEGALKVMTDDGQIKEITSGEVSVRGILGYAK